MGTRCLTVFEEEDGTEIAVLYRQMDGYPTGHGAELRAFLKGFRIVNGLSGDTTKTANGAGCLAAQVVAHFKDGAGQFYLHPAGTRHVGEEYVYTLRAIEGKPVKVKTRTRCEFFCGNPECDAPVRPVDTVR